MTCENHRRCDRILSLRSVARIQTGLNSCDISQRQTKSKRLVAEAGQTRRRVAATSRRDLSHRVSRPYLCLLMSVSVRSRLYKTISLIKKKKKNTEFLKNWRPVSLLNVDNKIAAGYRSAFEKGLAERNSSLPI